MKKQRRSITIKIEDDGNPKDELDPTPYLEAYAHSWRRKFRAEEQDGVPLDPNGFPLGLYFLDSRVNLTAEATWISTLPPYQVTLGRVVRRVKSRIRKYVELCRREGKRTLAIVVAVIPVRLFRLLFRRDR